MGSVTSELARKMPGLRTSETSPDRIAYARDLWPRHHIAVRDGAIAEHRPAGVVWPETTEDVAGIVRFCASEGIPIVPFGAGSGVCGGVLPHDRMIVVDLKRMHRWRTYDPAGTLDVEAGALGIRLEEDLLHRGHTLGHFPSSILCSTVGGWVAARSAGQCSGMYGKIEDMVLSLECVVGSGDIVTFQRRTHGPDVTPLIIGSEGVLGIVTSATLRLHPAPACRAFAAYSFPTVEAGWEAMREMFQAGLRPAVCRLYDAFDSFMARTMGGRKKKAQPPSDQKKSSIGAGGIMLRSALRVPGLINQLIDTIGEQRLGGAKLVLVLEGTEENNAADLSALRAIAERYQASDLGEAPARHWLSHRYAVSYRQAPIFMMGAFSDTMEVAAPWSKLGELYRSVRTALGKHVFVMAHLSHAYPDGCSIYFTFAGFGRDREATEACYDEAWRAAMNAALAAGGTLSHHHGVGRSKAPKLGAELGLGVDVIHALRKVIDPAGIMNPGNLLPRESPVRTAVHPVTKCTIDAASMLIDAPGHTKLAEVEAALQKHDLTLGIAPDGWSMSEQSVDGWIASGLLGSFDPLSDPVDHTVAGFTATLRSGAQLSVRTAPRRAVGPDLFALFSGTNGQVGKITSASLRGHSKPEPRRLPCPAPRDPPTTEPEQRWISALLDAARAVQ